MGERSPLEQALGSYALLSDEVRGSLNELGLVTIADLKFLFDSRGEADEAGLGLQWQSVQDIGTGVIGKAIAIMPKPVSQDVVTYTSIVPKVKPHKFRFKPAPSPKEDLVKREEVALKAVDLSLSWGGKGGFASKGGIITPKWKARQVRVISRYETRVVLAAITCWQRWVEWCTQNDVQPLTADVTDWEEFVECRSSAPTMARTTWTQLDWLATKLHAPIPIKEMPKPPKRTANEQTGMIKSDEQTPTADPELLAFYESRVVMLEEANDERLGAILAVLVEAYGGVRHGHMVRARLVGRTESSITGIAYRGKRTVGGTRPLLKFCFPRVGMTGVRFGDLLWDKWDALCRASKKVIFSIVLNLQTGSTLTIAQFNSTVHEVGAPAIAIAEDARVSITSYWFRSVGATLADMRRAPWHERLRLGDWKGGLSQPMGGEENLMPIRYSRCKDSSEKYVKLLHMKIMSKLICSVKSPVTWDKCRQCVEGMDLTNLRIDVAKILDADGEPQLAFGHKTLTHTLKGVKRVKLVSQRCSEVQSLVSQLSQKKEVLVGTEHEAVFNSVALKEESPQAASSSNTVEPCRVSHEDIVKSVGWAVGSRVNAVIHLTKGEGNLSLCLQRKKGGQPLNSVMEGVSLETLPCTNPFCTACLSVAPKDVLEYLAQVGREEQCEKIHNMLYG